MYPVLLFLLCFSFSCHSRGSSAAPFFPLCQRGRRESLRDVQNTWDGEMGAGLPGSRRSLEAVWGRQEESKFKKYGQKSSTQLLAQLAVLPSFCLQALGLIRETRVHLSCRNAKALLASSTFFKTHLKWQMANRYRYGFLIFFCSEHWSIDVAAVCCQRCDSLWLLRKLNRSKVIFCSSYIAFEFPLKQLLDAWPFLTSRVFFTQKSVLKPYTPFWPQSQWYSCKCTIWHFWWLDPEEQAVVTEIRERPESCHEKKHIFMAFALLTVKQFCCFNTYRSRNWTVFLEMVENRHW